jgi:hypothetical protein
MKINMLMTLIAFGVTGCKTSDSNVNSGAPPSGYETSGEAGKGRRTDTNKATIPSDGWHSPRYQGITPTVP